MAPHPAKTTSADRRIARETVSAAKRARAGALRKSGATLAEIGQALGLCVESARRLVLQAERVASRPDWHNRLNNTRALRFLRERDLAALPEIEAALAVAKFTRKELKAEPNFGKGALEAIETWLGGTGHVCDQTPITNKKGAPVQGRPHDSRNPLAADWNASSQCILPRNAP
jgi:hypothetical protein